MLKEAREIALQAGSAETAFQAIDLLGKYFEGDTAPMRTAALAALGK